MVPKIIEKSFAFLLSLTIVLSLLSIVSTKAFAGPNGETINFGVTGYTAGTTWEYRDAKSLSINANIPTVSHGNEYKIRITLPAGMVFNTFSWNNDWGAKPKNVEGSTTAFATGDIDLLEDNEVIFDDNGTENVADDITTLIYTISHDTTELNLSGKVIVQPKQDYVYTGDVIPGGVKIELLDGTGNLVSGCENSTDVTIGTVPLEWGWYSAKKLAAGAKNAAICDDSAQPILRYFYATDITMKIPMPEIVEDVSSATMSNAINNKPVGGTSNMTYDKSTHILTITNSGGIGNARYVTSIVGDISTSATTGAHYGAAPMTASWTWYDGVKVVDKLPVWAGNKSQINIAAADTYLKYSIEGLDCDSKTNPQFTDAATGIKGRINFNTLSDLTTDQIVSYSFPDELIITGVYFPNDNASELTDVKVSFNDGTTRTFSSISTININNTYISINSLKGLDSSITGSYIKSISANCGTFRAGYKADDTHVMRNLIGRYDDAVINAGVDADIPYIISVNGNDFTDFAYYRTTPNSIMNDKKNSYDFGIGLRTYNSDSGSASAGSSLKFRSHLTGDGPWGTNGVYEPELYIIEPAGFHLDVGSITALQKDPNGSDTAYTNGQINITPRTFMDEMGKNYNGYKVVVPGSYLKKYDTDGKYNPCSLDVSYTFDTDETLSVGSYNIGSYVYVASGTNFVGYSYDAYQRNNKDDRFDVNGNGQRDDKYQVITWDCKASVTENKNVIVSGYLAKTSGATTGLPAYSPGIDGSNDTNAVTFKPGDTAYYNVVVTNSVDTAAKPSTVKAYIPIAKATISNGTSTPRNTGTGVLVTGESTRYQFQNYNWPMTLTGIVTNTDPSIFSVLYYTGNITLDSYGNPTNSPTYTDPSSLTPAQAAEVTMVSIITKDGKSIPTVSGGNVYSRIFELPLSIGINEEAAANAGINNTKNIFRAFFYRSSDSGTGYSNSGYVAAKLSIGRIQGYAYTDVDNDGLYIASKGDKRLKNVKVKLYNSSNTLLQETITDDYGSYSFTGLYDGTYTVEFTNPVTTDINNAGARHFTHTVAYDRTNNYQFDSDAVADATHLTGSVSVTLPQNGTQASNHNDYICAGFAPALKVILKNSDAEQGLIEDAVYGTISDTGTEVKVWYGDMLTEPSTKTPAPGYAFETWKSVNSVFDFLTAVTVNDLIITGYWQGEEQNIIFDANSGTFSDGTDTLTGIKLNTGTALTKALVNAKYEEPVCMDFDFEGWYMDSDGKTPIGTNTMPYGGIIVYAKWSPSNVKVTLDPRGANFTSTGNDNPIEKSGKPGTFIELPQMITPSGKIFAGWYTDIDGKGVKLGDSPVFPDKNTTYYANWKEETIIVPMNDKIGNASQNVTAKAPQTGLLWWPVPILVICGLAVIGFGIMRKKRSSDEK